MAGTISLHSVPCQDLRLGCKDGVTSDAVLWKSMPATMLILCELFHTSHNRVPALLHINASLRIGFPSLPCLRAASSNAALSSLTVFTRTPFIHASGSVDTLGHPTSEPAASSGRAAWFGVGQNDMLMCLSVTEAVY
jgi:hypothetical protein